ncbi:MAG: biotin/lipoyl-containing protein [Pararhizobium sp.]|jgi:acetyl-CoA carboxylase biotin carboxyl carrier protein
MDLELIERLMRLLENSNVNELELTENGTRIRLSKTVAPQPSAASAASSSAATRANAAATGPKEHVIVAGLPGTFYRSPLPGEAPFVEIGTVIEDGSKLAIIEAMKMMNPVEADCAGRVTAIHVEDGALVTAGMPLMTIEKAA